MEYPHPLQDILRRGRVLLGFSLRILSKAAGFPRRTKSIVRKLLHPALWAGIPKGGALKVIFRIRIFGYSMLMVEFNLPKKNEMNVFSFPE